MVVPKCALRGPEDEYCIAFSSNEIRGVCKPHDDAPVITILIVNCEVKRHLVEHESSSNVLFWSVLKEMDLNESNIEHNGIVLTCFNKEFTQVVGTLRLLVYARGEKKVITFLIMDCPSVYNVILERPWIHDIRVVPTTYYQVI